MFDMVIAPMSIEDIVYTSNGRCRYEAKLVIFNDFFSFFIFSVQFFIAIWNTILYVRTQLIAIITCEIPKETIQIFIFWKQGNSWESNVQTNI